MIPENPFAKLVWCNVETMFKVAVEGVLVFGAAGLIAGEHFLLMIAAAVTYTFFSFFLIAANFLFLRFTGANMSAGVLGMLYMGAVVLVMLPGLIGAFSVTALLGDGGVNAGAAAFPGMAVLAGLGVLSAWELLLGLIGFAASKGILHRCDMYTLPQSTAKNIK
jgi:hypothetical protein